MFQLLQAIISTMVHIKNYIIHARINSSCLHIICVYINIVTAIYLTTVSVYCIRNSDKRRVQTIYVLLSNVVLSLIRSFITIQDKHRMTPFTDVQ